MRILAIETSCDETGIAIVDATQKRDLVRFAILSNALLSQAQLHAEFGGVYPTLAKREHEKNLPILLKKALTDAELTDEKTIEAIVVTHGPGLEPALWSGIVFAQRLAHAWHKPLFGVNHMEGHLISSLVRTNELVAIRFPVLGLLISGGHSEFILMRKWFSYEMLGETLDDAVGEAFDKVARMLGLPYPGGPHISRLAMDARNKNIQAEKRLPRPMLKSGNCDLSFSGLKTAMLYTLRDRGGIEIMSESERAAWAREFEDAAADVFVAKTRRALIQSAAKTFVIGGGVAANTHIRHALEMLISNEFPDVELRLPELSITGDNALMIAQAALMHLLADDWFLSKPPAEIVAMGSLSITSAK